ncbi:hypothetical protein TSA66_01435 [Noviherbaspirillum autotrophicum]|uniref:Response regulatory domain-containing protein n=1 Tax=Noviherbaspirillum autotrophicum TaxID=709839 RepID=A0A0C2BEY5_9BURK|nr:hypothetical protein TSA66_01435 [Noviherbaspirillum autotrophicum]
MQQEKRTLLLAIRPDDKPLATAIIDDDYHAVYCHTYEQAQACLDEDIYAVVCGIHFDNGKVFDYLRHVRTHPAGRDIPVFILLGNSSRYSPSIVHGMRRAAEVLGVTAFTDLIRLVDKVGKERAIDLLRQGLRHPSKFNPPGQEPLPVHPINAHCLGSAD